MSNCAEVVSVSVPSPVRPMNTIPCCAAKRARASAIGSAAAGRSPSRWARTDQLGGFLVGAVGVDEDVRIGVTEFAGLLAIRHPGWLASPIGASRSLRSASTARGASASASRRRGRRRAARRRFI